MINKQTTLELNGPILSITQNPVSVTASSGSSVTFTGIATATFTTQNPPNPAANDGYIAYQWYEVGKGALTDGTNIVGSATTTLIISNLQSPNDNGRQFYLSADYVPSAYSQPLGSSVTVGTARSTGNAINEPVTTTSASVSVYSLLSISQQPTDVTVSRNLFATFTINATSTDSTQGNITYQWQLNGSNLTDGPSVSGSTTNTLQIKSSTVGTSVVSCIVSNSYSSNSPLVSNTAIFNSVQPRNILNVEILPGTGGNATLYNWDLSNQGSFAVNSGQLSTPNTMCIYAPEKDIEVLIDMAANAGANNGGYVGGQGGKSTIKLTLKQNQEYMFGPISQTNTGSAIFMYSKAALIACIGGGGNAGNGGNGGDGGGINVVGGPGSGRGAGSGGILYQPGTLPSTGVFGSTISNQPLKSGDSIASAPNGGRTIPCTRGDYWYDRGYSACQDLGNVQFYTQNGSLISNSTSSIVRGFKAGYGIRNTAGAGLNGGGNGGNGATGGNGGNGGGGGGGGSGYTDGSVVVVSTQQGGNTGLGSINISLYVAPVKPVVNVTTNLPTTFTATAGDSNRFSVSANDIANTGTTFTYQWYLSTDGGSSYSALAGETGSSLNRYSTTYYSDNGNKFYCRITASNSAGTTIVNSNTCTLTVNKNYNCNNSSQSGYVLWGGGLHPSPETADVLWASYEIPYDNICQVNGRFNKDAHGRCDIGCANSGGVHIHLEVRIVGTRSGRRVHWGDQELSKNNCDYMSFNFSLNGGGWDFVTDGRPRLELWCLYNGTYCNNNNNNHNIFPESIVGAVDFTYTIANLFYENRP